MKHIKRAAILAGVAIIFAVFFTACGAMNGQTFVDDGTTSTTIPVAKDQDRTQKNIEGGIEDWERLGEINATEEQATMAKWICNAIYTLDGPHATAEIVEFEQKNC